MPKTPYAPSRLSLLLTSCALLGTVGGPALAQDNSFELGTIFIDSETEGTGDGETIVADQISSGSGLPSDVMESSASVSVITAREIKTRGATSTEQVLQYTSGVVTDFYGRDDRFDNFKIRGYEATAYRDGILIGDAFGGVREEPFAFDRVEVLKGANGTAFGVGDPGGAVNYITKSPTGERLREVYGTYGSFDHKELGFDVGDSFGDSDFSWRLTGKMQDAEAETDYSNDDETFFMAGLAWRPSSATTISLVYDHLFRDGYPNSSGYPATGEDFDRDLFLGEPDFNYLDTDRDTLTLKAEHDFGGGLEFGSTLRYTEGTGGFGYVYLDAVTSEADTTVSRFYFANDSEFENFAADAHLLYRANLGPVWSRTLGGVEYRDNYRENTLWWAPASDIDWTDPVYSGGLDLGSTTPYEDTDTSTKVASLYLQQEFTYGKFILQGGLRRDWIDQKITNNLADLTTETDDTEDTYRLGLTYMVSPNVSVYGSYAESVVPASEQGNEPERGEQYEIGVKYRPDNFRGLFTASIYDLTKFNQTITDPDTLLEVTRGESRVRGLDLEAKAEITDQLSLTAAYSYMESELVASSNGADDGNELAHTPEHSGSVWVDYLVPGQGRIGDLNLGLGARYTGAYWRADSNASKTDSAWIWDAAIGYEIVEGTEMRMNVSNLLDEKHIAQGGFSTDYYNAGREVSLSLRHSW